jgi:hypothetical protein
LGFQDIDKIPTDLASAHSRPLNSGGGPGPPPPKNLPPSKKIFFFFKILLFQDSWRNVKKLVPDHAHKNLSPAHPQKISKFYFSMIRGETWKKSFTRPRPQKFWPRPPPKIFKILFFHDSWRNMKKIGPRPRPQNFGPGDVIRRAGGWHVA